MLPLVCFKALMKNVTLKRKESYSITTKSKFGDL